MPPNAHEQAVAGPEGVLLPASGTAPGLDTGPAVRRPFGRNPGLWHVPCPTCGRWVRVLLLANAAAATGAWWGCRRCLGIVSAASLESPETRRIRAAQKAAGGRSGRWTPRRPGERLPAYRRRALRALATLTEVDGLIEQAEQAALGKLQPA